MYKEISDKQFALYHWRNIPAYKECETLLATGAFRTGKTEIGSRGFTKDGMKMVRATPKDYRTKGYNLFTIVSTSKSLAFLNIIEPSIKSLEIKGYRECKTVRQFYKSKGNTFVHTTAPLGLLQIKDNEGNVTRFLYVGADNKRALNRVTGITCRGWFLDEAPLLGGNEEENVNFINVMYERTATFRVEPYGRPLQIMTTNPQSGDEGLFYQTYIKGGWFKKILVMTFTLLDNPRFSQSDVEYYKRILTKAQFLRKVMGRWVKDSESLVYPKFDKKIHVIPHKKALKYRYKELAIGLDEGQRDARAFVLAGFRGNHERIVYIDEYYHKNNENEEPKDINEYVKDFIDKTYEWYIEFGVTLVCYVDSASLSLITLLKKATRKHNHVVIKAVYKGVETRNDRQAILERIDFTNMLLGSERVEYSDKCKHLINATIKCTKKDGKRIDDGKTNNIDSLDASEYAVKHRLKKMTNMIMLAKGGN